MLSTVTYKMRRSKHSLETTLVSIVFQGRVGDPHRDGRDGARTVADGCVDTPAMLVQRRTAKPYHARVVALIEEREKGSGNRPLGPLARRAKGKDLWLSVRQWQHAGHRVNV